MLSRSQSPRKLPKSFNPITPAIAAPEGVSKAIENVATRLTPQ